MVNETGVFSAYECGFWYNGGNGIAKPRRRWSAPERDDERISFAVNQSYPLCIRCNNPVPRTRLGSTESRRFCSPECQRAHWREVDERANPLGLIANGSVGAVAELLTSADLLRRGYHVFRSVSPSCPCDLIIWKDGTAFHRIEVRTGFYSSSGINAPVSPKDAGRFDVLAVVSRDGQVCYVPEGFIDGPANVLPIFETLKDRVERFSGAPSNADEVDEAR